MRSLSNPRRLAHILGATALAAALLGACQAEFPDGSPYNNPSSRAALEDQVNDDVSAMLRGIQRAQELRDFTERLRTPPVAR